jgi:tetratricopeptide (TPR) repeat protein
MIIGWSFMKQEIAILKIASISQGSKLNETEIQNYLAALNFFSKDEIRRAIYLSDFYLRIEKLGDSQVLMEEITRKDPDAVEAFEQLARLARFSKDLNRELEYRKEIEQIDPFNYKNLLAIAQTSVDISNSIEAISYAKKVLSISTDKTINESATVILQNSK